MSSSECPICFRHVMQENLILHVESCLAKGSTDLKPQTLLPKVSKLTPNENTNKLLKTSPISLNIATPPISKKRKFKEASKSDYNGQPLADRMRPISLDNIVGQDELLGPDKLLTKLILADRTPNMILWGPPGCGKTTIANVIAHHTGCQFVTISGSTSKVDSIREAIQKAKREKALLQRRTILFVDEIHRFNKNQQDLFLPAVEDGTITLVGATTENPSFQLNNALISRCRVYVLKKHTTESIQNILQRAIADSSSRIESEDGVLSYLAEKCDGDARVALNCLEMAINSLLTDTSKVGEETCSKEVEDGVESVAGSNVNCNNPPLTLDYIKHCFTTRQSLQYDRMGDLHYDCISAFHKSIRGSDENATLYWLARMLEGGEDPLYVARRLIRIASEDIGLAASHLVPLAISAYQSAQFIGMPECDVVLAHCATELARAPKSVEVYQAYGRAKRSIREWDKGSMPEVPLHLRNAPTKLLKQLGHGKDYKWNPAYTAEELKDQTYLPDELIGTDFFKNDETMK